jgi:fructose/tagatose bisphosphate aldolase
VSRRIIVHSLVEARAALAAAAALGMPVTLMSAAGAGAYAGPRWFKALIAAARAEHPDVVVEAVLDCAEEAGTVMSALRAGITRVRFTGSPSMRDRLAAIAAATGASLEDESGDETLDLLEARDPAAVARAFLAGNGTPP